MNIRTPEFVIPQLPALELCGRLHLGMHDVIVHAPGFEDRTMALMSCIEPTKDTRVALMDYRPLNSINRLRDVRDALVALGLLVREQDVLEYDRFEPKDFEARLSAHLRANAARRVILDISTMSKLGILLTMNVCLALDLEIVILYSEAEVYGPSQEEFEKAKKNKDFHRPTIQIFTGVHGVVRATSLASVAMQGQPTAALVFMSFNDALTQVLLNTVYPSRLFLINGKPPVHDWREEATAWIHDQVRREWAEDNPVRERDSDAVPRPQRVVSTLDYRETVSLLVGLYWQLSATHRVLLSPSGSKMQAVGCSIVKALHEDIHIEYPSPEGFLPQYSSGVAGRWVLRLGRLGNLLERIRMEERREFLELSVG